MRELFKGLVFFSLCLCSSVALCSVQFEKQLLQADSLRSADAKQFEKILQLLDENAGEASADQLEYLRYLQAYKIAYTGQYNLAIQKASAIFDQSKNATLKYRAGLLMTNSYAVTRDFGSAFSTLDKTLLLQDKVSDPKHRHDGLFIAALLYNQVGQYQLGKDFVEKILSDNPDPRMRCLSNSLLLEATYKLKSFPSSETDIDSLIHSCSDHGELLLANVSRTYFVRSLADKGETRKAISILEQYLDEVNTTSYPRLVSDVHSLLSDYKLRLGDLAQAEQHANIAVKQSATIPFSQSLVVAEKTLYEIAVKRKNVAAALDHYKKYAEADKAYLNDVKARELAYQLVKHETQQKSQTIDLLSRKNRVLELEQTVAKQKAHYGIVLLVLLAILLALLVFWAYRTKRMQMAFRKLAEIDTLTGISNRDHFNKNVEHALVDAGKKLDPLGMVMFDLDYFKSINDRFGHATGDWVLKQVVEACKPVCRKNDCLGRIGGEEFAILLHVGDLSGAMEMAERFRNSIASIDTSETGHVFTVTASFGVTTTQISGYSFDSLVSNADEALYQAKHAGRNRVSAYSRNGGIGHTSL
jgi:diguanylate cyclase